MLVLFWHWAILAEILPRSSEHLFSHFVSSAFCVQAPPVHPALIICWLQLYYGFGCANAVAKVSESSMVFLGIDGTSSEPSRPCKTMRSFELMTDFIDRECLLGCGAELYSPRESILNGDFISVEMISFD